jgi:hypothetical protein
MGSNLWGKGFQMTENSRRNREIPRRDTEMVRANAIQFEMAEAVRFLGGPGSAKEQTARAARETKLSQTVIERLRWRKIKRVPADIADVVREAVERQEEKSLARAQHELTIAQITNARLVAELEAVRPGLGRQAAVEGWR